VVYSEPTYSVSGTVTDNTGSGLAGVALTLTPGGFPATANSHGNYTISGVPDGSYTLTPSLGSWYFVPPNRPVTVSGGDVSGQNFTASLEVGTHWVHSWGGGSGEEGRGVAVDNEGNVYVAGVTGAAVLLLKYSSVGDLLWRKAWDGSGLDCGSSVSMDGSGNAYVTGYTYSFGAGLSDVLLLKYDASGELLWQKTWGGSGHDYGQAVAVDSSGNAYVTGYSSSFGADHAQIVLVKYSSGGNLLWQKAWGGSGDEVVYGDVAYGVAVDDSGNVYVTGYTDSFGAGSVDVVLIKFAASGGAMLWQKTWGGTDFDAGRAVAVDESGNVYVTGYTQSFGAGIFDVALLKYSSTGDTLCQKTWGGTSSDLGQGVAADGSGKVYLCGSAPSIYGSLQDVSGTETAPLVALATPSGILDSPGGTETEPSGTETIPEGVEDEGGALIMKLDSSLW